MAGLCLVTGGAGFIGCAVSDALVASFDRVVAMDNLHPQVHSGGRPSALNPAVELVIGDVTVAGDWDRLLADARPDVVIHLAAETGTGQSLTEASRHALVNVVGTTQMLDAFVRASVTPKRIVLSSSRAVYGEGAWTNDAGDLVYPGQRPRSMLGDGVWDFPGLSSVGFEAARVQPMPTSIYGATKLAQEHIIKSWAASFGTEVATLRLQNVYGPGQSLKNAYTGIVVLFAQIARRHEVIPVYEDGRITRDFVYIEDVAGVMAKAAIEGVPSPLAYDVGFGTATSLLDLARAVASHYGAPEPVINGKFRDGDVRHASCDIGRTRSDLGYEPRWPLGAGLERLFAWIDRELN